MKRPAKTRTPYQAEMRQIFLHQVHRLLWMGYTRLKAKSCQNEHEPSITGLLVDAMTDVRDEAPEPWVRFYAVHDDPPVGKSKKKGKDRSRVDIKIESLRFSPSAKFSFEAKRLGPNNGMAEYVGEAGLGCFICGDYARDASHAGMLGYVQSSTAEDWASKIDCALRNNECALAKDHHWHRQGVPKTKLDVFCSHHNRRKGLGPLIIYHTLLCFC